MKGENMFKADRGVLPLVLFVYFLLMHATVQGEVQSGFTAAQTEIK